MSRTAAVSFSFLAVACFALGYATEARACSCVEPDGVKEALASAGSVLEGRVEELRHDPALHRITARVSVLRRWKGARAKTVEVVTIDAGSLCGFGFERKKSYLLFTPEASGTLSVSLCSRSKTSEAAAADFVELDRLAAPEAATPSPSASVQRSAPALSAPVFPPPLAPTALPPPATEPRGSGCAGCNGTGVSGPINGVPMLVAVALWASSLRRRATVLPKRTC